MNGLMACAPWFPSRFPPRSSRSFDSTRKGFSVTISETTPTTITTRFAIIGAGAGGLCAGIKLLERGQADFLIFDREPRVGGTWQVQVQDPQPAGRDGESA